MSAWKECPNSSVEGRRRYSLSEENPRVVTNIGGWWCTVIGSTPLPLNKVTSWSIKVLRSENNDGGGIFAGVAPFDIDQNKGEGYDCGWHLNCWNSTLWSGLPQSQRNKEYGPRKENGGYVRTGENVGVIMDTAIGELSFVFGGVNLGVAYSGIPLDKPLVPCVSFRFKGDCVELDTSEVKENIMDSSISVPSNITAKSTTWNSITLRWDAVEGASFYQIEADGGKIWDASTTNTFTKRELPEGTEHTFRVRAVIRGLVGEWSCVAKETTLKTMDFSGCVWKKCPDDIAYSRKYSVDEKNPRIATKIGGWDDGYCIIIGNTFIPPNKVTSWSIRTFDAKRSTGHGIYIGVASSDIDQNENYNYNICGWYIHCYDSTLYSGPPHNYNYKKYGVRNNDGTPGWLRKIVGVVMDATKGELSFALNGMNLGIAYEGIPLNKPLVPCVLLWHEGDTVELDTSEVKENVDRFHNISNIEAKSITWDSITLTWSFGKYASFYQIEVDGSKFWEASTTNTFTKRGLLPETEHTFRVRAVRENSVSKWSDIMRGTTEKRSFETSGWKECPDKITKDKKYYQEPKNPRIATKINFYESNYGTIIGNTPLPPNTTTTWGIKVVKPKNNVGKDIHIGVAPFGIDQNDDNLKKCGWYFDCYESTLYSGPPHNYRGKKYGPRKENGKYVHTGDSVGVVMDTGMGELSFVVNGVNLGVAYEGIPLNKPLVPCVILGNKGDSVELVI